MYIHFRRRHTDKRTHLQLLRPNVKAIRTPRSLAGSALINVGEILLLYMAGCVTSTLQWQGENTNCDLAHLIHTHNNALQNIFNECHWGSVGPCSKATFQT
ncbi:hypothetical protein BDBG_17329 [Blastomyces gilchristii SLH14081]|uniref:Uncharacterized protein n=1 Tax=Blastomyces gilchristii (strain SLH14081) TaxID=559298 RepID=A0A179UQ31_BLAGS|nr:uncharacterized protein BDBG_17329 [Blastomyces gilchristii SLH14081]OAT10206.1 hypothetical protein BDBG_17329 [Blastomyces gilchristii SLH14081]